MTATIDLSVPEGTLRLHVSTPDAVPRTVVVVLHELFGVNPDIAAVVDDLAAAGHLAVAPELYHRTAEPGDWLARDDDGRAEGFRRLHTLTRDGVVADVEAVRAWAAAQGVEDVVLLGFSAGGHAAFVAASGIPVRATVLLYAGWLTSTDIPLSTPRPSLELADRISGSVLYLVGEADPLVPAADRVLIDAVLTSAGVPHEVVVEPGAAHAYFWEGTPAYDAAARADSWGRLLHVINQK